MRLHLLAAAVGLTIALDGCASGCLRPDGTPIDPAARYRLEPEHGPRRLQADRGGERSRAATGRALLGLAADRMPGADDLASLRGAMRDALAHHLGGRGLKSWELMGRFARPAPALPPD